MNRDPGFARAMIRKEDGSFRVASVSMSQNIVEIEREVFDVDGTSQVFANHPGKGFVRRGFGNCAQTFCVDDDARKVDLESPELVRSLGKSTSRGLIPAAYGFEHFPHAIGREGVGFRNRIATLVRNVASRLDVLASNRAASK
jgi:hypothetical protein